MKYPEHQFLCPNCQELWEYEELVNGYTPCCHIAPELVERPWWKLKEGEESYADRKKL